MKELQKYRKFYEKKIGFPKFPDEHFVFECKPTLVKIWDEELYAGNGKIIHLT